MVNPKNIYSFKLILFKEWLLQKVMELVKKKRGRKPKNYFTHTDPEPDPVIEKKKRGRKKKYEIENFEKILHRNEENNFDHSIAYSDDDEHQHVSEDTSIKKVSFGSLDITVSKKIVQQL